VRRANLKITTEHIFVAKICRSSFCFGADKKKMAVIAINMNKCGRFLAFWAAKHLAVRKPIVFFLDTVGAQAHAV
jgi:hypothetical protein